MASYDAGTLTNKSKRSARIYKDLNLDFQQNTATKDIQKMLDVEAVKRSVRNLININHYEKPFHPEIGSNLRAMLFENLTPAMNHVISKNIELLIANYEPRCRLVQVNTQPMFERNGYAVQISFYVVNYPEPVEVETFLERLR
jgi:phage baseplate assembly protein W